MTQHICTIERPYLAAALKSAARFRSAKHSYLPILSNVLLRCEADRIHVAGTDLDHSAIVSAPAQGDPFAVAFNPSAALQWLAQTKGDAIQLTLTDPARIEIASSDRRSRLTVPVWSREEFPVLPKLETESAIQVDAVAFCDALKAVLPLAGKPSRRALGRVPAVHFLVEDQSLVVAACDGARFGKRDVALVSEVPVEKFAFALSPLALSNLVKLVADSDYEGPLFLARNDACAFFQAATGSVPSLLSVSARLLDTSLDLEKLQAHFDAAAGAFTVETKVLNRAFRRLSRIAKQDSDRIECHIQPGVMEVRARSNESGQACGEVPADVDGEPIQIAFNQKQLADVLKSVKSEQVVFEHQGDARKVVRVVGVLIVPVESFQVEESRRLAKRTADEAVAKNANVASLANSVEDHLRGWQQRSIFVDVTNATFKNLDQIIGNNSTWPEELQKLPYDLKATLRQRVADELVQRGVLQRGVLQRGDGGAWQISFRWASAQLESGEAKRREQARTALREGVQESINKNLRNTAKIAYANVLLEWHIGAQDQPYPYRDSDLSFPEASDVRSRFTRVLNTVKSRFEPQEQGGSDEQ